MDLAECGRLHAPSPSSGLLLPHLPFSWSNFPCQAFDMAQINLCTGASSSFRFRDDRLWRLSAPFPRQRPLKNHKTRDYLRVPIEKPLCCMMERIAAIERLLCTESSLPPSASVLYDEPFLDLLVQLC
jgi:hypothetical protein